MAEQLRVMISSTARDLPEHRKEAMDACLRQGMFPIMMEHLPASDDEAVPASLRMVDEADIYLLILAHRYGYVPAANNPTRISVTEHEYNRALERKIPILTFAMHDDHNVKVADVEKGDGRVKLEAFKKRALLKGTNFFKSSVELRADLINSLSRIRQPDLTALPDVSDIPARPEAYIAHPYTLLQTDTLIGRKAELKLLTDWITGKELEANGYTAPPDSVRIMSVVAIGGMGKSALTWKWFNEVAPQKMKNLAGRIWWSFDQSDGNFKNFVTRALAYVKGRERKDIEKIPVAERENLLLSAFDREPFLIVLDGFDRLLNIFSRLDAPGEDPSDVVTIKESNGALSLSDSGTRQLNKAANPRIGNFLRKLSNVHASRILINVRTDVADLQTETGRTLPGVFAYHLNDLSDEDALHLWQQFGVKGSRAELLDFFHTFGNLPLLIQTLAGLVAWHRPAPHDFDDWHRANPTPDRKRLEERIAEILSAALHVLDEDVKIVLNTIAAFYVKAPVPYDTLANLLGAKKGGGGKRGPGMEDRALDNALTELQQRGLVGWDKQANVYNLHPLIRRTVLSSLTGDAKQETYENLLEYFRGLSRRRRYQEVKRLEDLTAEMEQYHALIQLGQFEKAGRTFMQLLDKQLAYGLGNHRRRAKLLRLFFTRGLNVPPQHRRPGGQTFILGTIATAYLLCGQYSVAAALYEMELEMLREMETRVPHSKPVGKLISQRKIGVTFGQMGKLYRAQRSLRAALLETRNINDHFHEAICWQWLGILHATRGDIENASTIFQRAEGILSSLRRSPPVGLIYAFSAQCQLWLGDLNAAQKLLEQASESPKLNDRDWIRVKRLQGCALLAQFPQQVGGTRVSGGQNILSVAEEKFNFALHKAREVTHVREEIQSLIGLAELNWRRNSSDAARDLLKDVMELAASGPDRLSHADACVLLARIERDERNVDTAIEAATKAYQLAWCDGPPFAYHWVLEKAKQHLKELGAPEPEMPPFDESTFEPDAGS